MCLEEGECRQLKNALLAAEDKNFISTVGSTSPPSCGRR
jgi:hypothetical protein